MLELSRIFGIQKDFDRRMDWNRYENCKTPEDILDFFQHFILVMVDELGEISRFRKKFRRDQPMQRMRRDRTRFLEEGNEV